MILVRSHNTARYNSNIICCIVTLTLINSNIIDLERPSRTLQRNLSWLMRDLRSYHQKSLFLSSAMQESGYPCFFYVDCIEQNWYVGLINFKKLKKVSTMTFYYFTQLIISTILYLVCKAHDF